MVDIPGIQASVAGPVQGFENRKKKPVETMQKIPWRHPLSM